MGKLKNPGEVTAGSKARDHGVSVQSTGNRNGDKCMI